jgi:hypothetical protein
MANVSLFFGTVVFVITAMTLKAKWTPLLLAICAAAVVFLFLSLMMYLNLRKYEHAEDSIEDRIILKSAANYYFGKLITNGLLFLTSHSLIFISYAVKPTINEEIEFRDIQSATHDPVFRTVKGLKLVMKDSSVRGFVLRDIPMFLEHITPSVPHAPADEQQAVN